MTVGAGGGAEEEEEDRFVGDGTQTGDSTVKVTAILTNKSFVLFFCPSFIGLLNFFFYQEYKSQTFDGTKEITLDNQTPLTGGSTPTPNSHCEIGPRERFRERNRGRGRRERPRRTKRERPQEENRSCVTKKPKTVSYLQNIKTYLTTLVNSTELEALEYT